MADQLTATSNSQSQTTTQGASLQPTGAASDSGTNSTSLQPGTTTSLLSGGQGGVPIRGTALSTVNLNTPAPALPLATTAAAVPVRPKHHVNPALFGFPVVLLLVAIVLFWATGRSVKSTT